MKNKNKYNEFYNIINPILNSEEFKRRRNYNHHGTITVYDHSLKVAKISYNIARLLHLNKTNVTIAAILHDFYPTPWQQISKTTPFFKKHGFSHAQEALINARKYYPHILNPIIENAILRHMFPLNIIPPRYKESWIVTLADKWASLNVFLHPKIILSFLGFKIK